MPPRRALSSAAAAPWNRTPRAAADSTRRLRRPPSPVERSPGRSRAVSRGSSASAVPMPIATASDSARQRCTRRRLALPEIQRESPVSVATLPSSDIAALNSTSGRPVRECLRNGWLRRRARCASSPSATTTSTPSSRRIPSPRPAALPDGSSEATTTRPMPASTIASVHGGVLPRWQHGSSDTKSVVCDPGTPLPPAALIASTSACGAPNSEWKPSPTTSPSRVRTAPTSGLGLTRPRPRSASSMARARWRSSDGDRGSGIAPVEDTPAFRWPCRRRRAAGRRSSPARGGGRRAGSSRTTSRS